jgi:hypothetical protein
MINYGILVAVGVVMLASWIWTRMKQREQIDGVWKLSSDFAEDADLPAGGWMTLKGSHGYVFFPDAVDEKIKINWPWCGGCVNLELEEETALADWDGAKWLIDLTVPQITIISADNVVLAHFVKDGEGTIIGKSAIIDV